MVNGKAVQDRPDYWQMVKFVVEREVEINFDDVKKLLKPKATTHFKYDCKKANLPVNPTVQMVTPAPEGEAESYEASLEDASLSAGDIKVAVRVAHASEVFSWKWFCCGKVGHHFRDEECKMYDPDFLNLRQGPAKTNQNQQAPRVRKVHQPIRTKASQ